MGNDNLSEKVSVNINTSTLSNIDLLVDNGYYSNRSDFIKQALRGELQRQQSIIDRIIAQNTDRPGDSSRQWFIGVTSLTQKDIDAFYEEGKPVDVTAYGILRIAGDVDRTKLYASVRSVTVKGKFIASEEIRKHYGFKPPLTIVIDRSGEKTAVDSGNATIVINAENGGFSFTTHDKNDTQNDSQNDKEKENNE